MDREGAIFATLGVYNVVLIGIGLLSQRRTHDGVDYFLGGRALGPAVAAISASASSSSAWTLLAVSGAAFQHGLAAVWFFPACVGGFALNWFAVAPRLRDRAHRTGAVTLTDAVVGGGPWQMPARFVATLIVVFSLAIYVGSQFHGAGKTFSDTFGFPEVQSILLGAAVVLLYTLTGGFWAVSLTDTLQGMLMAATAVVLPVAALAAIGGPGQLLDGMRGVDSDVFMDPLRGYSAPVALGFVFGTLGIGLGYPGQPHVVNRFMALRQGVRELRRARTIALAWAVCVYGGMLLLGWCGRVLFGELEDHEVVFIRATNELFPPVLAGVMIAAVLSAIMSTADSQLLVAGSSVAHDLRRPGAAGAAPAMLRRSRVVVLVLGLISVVVALVMIRHRSLFDSVLFAWSAIGAAFGPLLLVVLWRRPLPAGRSLAVMLMGFGSSVVASLTTTSPGKILENVVPFGLALAVALWPGASSPFGRREAAHASSSD